jgi:hypothetical protein
MATIEFLPFATAGGANVVDQADYAGSAYQTGGFTTGEAYPQQANKPWRQATIMAAALANVVSVALGGANVFDDGNLATLIGLLTTGIQALALKAPEAVTAVTYASALVFDFSLGRRFELTLTGNNASASFTNLSLAEGAFVVIMLKQDGTGGRVFTPPANCLMPTPDPAANQTTTYLIYVDSTGAPHIAGGPNVG